MSSPQRMTWLPTPIHGRSREPASLASCKEVGTTLPTQLTPACSVNFKTGAFTEFLAIPWDLVWSIGDLPYEEAATISMCGLTAAQGLDRQGLSLPFSPQPTDSAGKTYVIYGASTSLAMYAAQLARALDPAVTLIGVASKGKHDFLRREFGYDYLFDYRDNDWAEQIAALGPVDYAFDAITEGDSTKSLDRILADDGKLVVFRFPKGEFKHEPVYGAVWEGLGEDVDYGRELWLRSCN